MAGMWDQLPMDQKRAIANVALQGQKKTPENYNRIMQQLSENPRLVAQFATDAGIDVPGSEVQDGTEASDSERIDRYVDKSLNQTGNNDVPGDLQKTSNGGLEDRVRMLEQALGGNTGPTMPMDAVGPPDEEPMTPQDLMRAQMMSGPRDRLMRGPVRGR